MLVVMSDQLIAASEATKTHTELTDTFQSRDFGPFGIVDKDRIIVTRRPARREHIACEVLEERVDLVKVSAGSDGRFIDFAIDTGAKGIVIEGLGRGNVTVATLPAIERAVKAGLPVVITSRCPRGRVLDTYAYEGAGRQLKRMGSDSRWDYSESQGANQAHARVSARDGMSIRSVSRSKVTSPPA